MNIRKKYGLIFGAVIVTVLLISSTTAINVVQLNVKESNDVYVDPNIHLTRKHLPLLIRTERQIEDLDYKKIVQEIIDVIKNNMKADSYDIQEIIEDYDLDVSEVYAPALITTGGSDCAGFAFTIPGGLLLMAVTSLLSFGGLYFQIGIGGIMSWEASKENSPHYGIHIEINGNSYTTSHEGFSIGFFGTISGHVQQHPWDDDYFEMIGLALLVFIR